MLSHKLSLFKTTRFQYETYAHNEVLKSNPFMPFISFSWHKPLSLETILNTKDVCPISYLIRYWKVLEDQNLGLWVNNRERDAFVWMEVL